jgi:hypothetical protein
MTHQYVPTSSTIQLMYVPTHQLLVSTMYPTCTLTKIPLLAQGQTQGSNLQQHTNKTLTTSPFGNTCEVDEVSLKVDAGVVAGLRCLQP